MEEMEVGRELRMESSVGEGEVALEGTVMVTEKWWRETRSLASETSGVMWPTPGLARRIMCGDPHSLGLPCLSGTLEKAEEREKSLTNDTAANIL
ncbi:hypothetical protein Syun_013346 [Stephania yunnanensis]|uniref:Uncharacterized protein n=1 Tax=Stephania yunnanensis TaxID=152371 RepID=A0AAP0K186_9MAGN